MAHVRQQIRDAIVTALTGLATTGASVFRSRIYPIEAARLPGLCVYTMTEASEIETISRPRLSSRDLTVAVEAYVSGVSNYDNTLDTISAEVEQALAADPSLGGLAKDLKIAAFEAEFAGEGEQPVAVGRITVAVEYAVAENNVETAA